MARRGMGELFGVEGLQEDLVEGGKIVGSAVAAVVVGTMAINKLPWIKDQSTKVKAGAAIALGLGGGIVLGRMGYRQAASGVAAGLAGWGALKLLGDFVPSLAVGGINDVGAPNDEFYNGVEGSDDELLLGDVSVQDQTSVGDPVTIREGGMNGIDGGMGGDEDFAPEVLV